MGIKIDPTSQILTTARHRPTRADFFREHHEIGVAAGYYPGVFDVHKFGHNGAVGSTLETLWNESTLYVYRSTPTIMQVSSADADDTSAGAGAQTVLIEGTDGAFIDQMEIVSMNGQTQVPTVGLYLRVFRMKVLTAGASLWNEGIIYCGTGSPTAGKPAVVHGLIEQFENQSLMALFTIPAGFVGYVTQTLLTSAISKAVNGGLYAREPGGVFQVKEHLSVVAGEAVVTHTVADKYPGKTDLEMRAKAGAGGGDVSGQFELICVKDVI